MICMRKMGAGQKGADLSFKVINRTSEKLKQAQSPQQRTLHGRVQALMKTAADRLANQHKYSRGYGVGASDAIAEANIVLHLGAVSLERGFAPWLESAWGGRRGRLKRLDLYVDMTPQDERETLLLIEAKRLLATDKKKKLREIVADCKRLDDWSRAARKPLLHAVAGAQSVTVAIAIICPDESMESSRGQVTLSKWWKRLKDVPCGFSSTQARALRNAIKPMKRFAAQSRIPDGGKRLTILCAYLKLPSSATKGLLDV